MRRGLIDTVGTCMRRGLIDTVGTCMRKGNVIDTVGTYTRRGLIDTVFIGTTCMRRGLINTVDTCMRRGSLDTVFNRHCVCRYLHEERFNRHCRYLYEERFNRHCVCRYLHEERLEVQVWLTNHPEDVEKKRPRHRDKMIGCAYLDLSSLADRRRRQHRVR